MDQHISEHTPDKWAVIKITKPEQTIYKIFASWYGGYTGSDKWRMNSGITGVTDDKKFYYFKGHSGSIYKCHKESYGVSGWSMHILSQFLDAPQKEGVSIKLLDEDDNWKELNYDDTAH